MRAINFSIAFAISIFLLSNNAFAPRTTGNLCPSLSTVGTYNVCLGSGTTSNGYYNTAIGESVLRSNSSGYNNTAVGYQALYYNTSGYDNTAMGYQALFNNQTYTGSVGKGNVAIGKWALLNNTIGSSNVAVGTEALKKTDGGNGNVAVGNATIGGLANNFGTNNNSNTAVGDGALSRLDYGDRNIAVGAGVASGLTGGTDNIYVGGPESINGPTFYEDRTIRIGRQGTQSNTYIAGIYGSSSIGGTTYYVCINSNGQLYTYTDCGVSSRRYKEDIETMKNLSDKLMNLRPVTFHYKESDKNGNKTLQYGLIAEEVDEVIPELVIRNKEGKPESVAYNFLPSLLLNEYQRQNRELETTKSSLKDTQASLSDARIELTATKTKISEMQSQIESLNAITKKLMADLPTSPKAAKTAMAK